MKPVSPLDAQFLNVEDTTTTGHVGAVVMLDPSTAPGGGLSLDELRALLEPRLHLAPPFRQRLVNVPFGLGNPYWADDPDFDIEFHLRELALPAPGDDHQLGEQIARIHARPLDRSRPLWELYLVHGVRGDRAALYFKVHHAAIDGVTGAELLATIMDVTPEPRAVEPDDWSPAPLPGPEQLVPRAIATNTRTWSHALASMPRSLPHLSGLPGAANVPGARQVSDAADAVMTFLGRGSKGDETRHLFAPPTPFNGPITAHRRFSFGSVSLETVKSIKQAYDLTVNDVVMALTTSALRSWLLDHDALPELPLVAAIPVSIRDDSGVESGNQISVMLVRIPTHLRDPAERLTYLHDEVAVAKERFEAVPATILQDFSAALPTGLSGLASRALFRMITVPGLPFNLFISNVPGPQFPLYVDGATVEGIHPISAVTQLTGGINITLFSYNGSLDFGVVVCREMVPDVWSLIGYLEDALSELHGLGRVR
ncbi:WS/DGAT/MGAT family O-acyltransferase [Solicola gregarius]|uniref:Diacylglycerol O-acyltransferase n=1 Tax=Solicola gregarius TaxID=2908642 RepID=A0AA46YL66_9ACTN|nr:wax ester/triacylglycerol synthase family O-acyltransferase [Solicola gregarius]UYM06252.1 wax ester/triacylglycerol synthase family O-acyltransferase [Solicola gregarius]